MTEIEGLHRNITNILRMNKPPAAYLEDELHHFSVDQTVDRLPVDVGDEVTGTQASFLGRAAVLYMLRRTQNIQAHHRAKSITCKHSACTI